MDRWQWLISVVGAAIAVVTYLGIVAAGVASADHDHPPGDGSASPH